MEKGGKLCSSSSWCKWMVSQEEVMDGSNGETDPLDKIPVQDEDLFGCAIRDCPLTKCHILCALCPHDNTIQHKISKHLPHADSGCSWTI